MPCSQVNLGAVTMSAPAEYSTSFGYTPISGTRLYVCDNPEPLISNYFTNASMITLWEDQVPATLKVKYRVFMWHHNETGNQIKYGLTVGSAGSPITVSEIKFETAVTTNGGDILTNAGQCLAKALLGKTLTSGTADISVPTNGVRTVKEFTLEKNEVRGVIMEFTLTSANLMVAKIRTVAAKNAAQVLNTHQGPVIGTVLTHPRGTWNYADVQGDNFTLSLGSSNVSNSVGILGTPAVFPEYSSNDTVYPNPGSYGGIYNVNITITNTSGRAQTANLYLNPRGGLYAGAIKVGSNAVNGINKVKAGEAVKVGAFSLAIGQSITVPVQLTTAGGSSTPIGFFVRGL